MKYGEIWQLGEHKLMCGDSTDKECVMKLMGNEKAKLLFTSPPYADIRDYQGCNNDPSYLAGFIGAFKDYCDVMCVNLGFKRKEHEIITYWDEYINRAHNEGLKLLGWNVWDKFNPSNISQQQMMFPLRHEFIFVFGKQPYKTNRTIPKHGRIDPRNTMTIRQADGTFKITTKNPQIHEPNKPLESVIQCHPAKGAEHFYGHAVMPRKLAIEYIKACTNEEDYVIDCFGGSGTTLIACEITGRKCLMMEISPEYCEIIKSRFEKLAPLFNQGNSRLLAASE